MKSARRLRRSATYPLPELKKMLGCTRAMASGMSQIFQFFPWSEEMATMGRSILATPALPSLVKYIGSIQLPPGLIRTGLRTYEPGVSKRTAGELQVFPLSFD